jgi:hypothetical protein
MNYGTTSAKHGVYGTVWATNNAWRALQVGSAPHTGRKWLEIQNKGPAALAIQYVNKSNTDGTFTTPSGGPGKNMVVPRNSIKVFPLSESITVFGLAYGKAGSSATGSLIVVSEFS